MTPRVCLVILQWHLTSVFAATQWEMPDKKRHLIFLSVEGQEQKTIFIFLSGEHGKRILTWRQLKIGDKPQLRMLSSNSIWKLIAAAYPESKSSALVFIKIRRKTLWLSSVHAFQFGARRAEEDN